MIKSVTQHSYFEEKPNQHWVDFKTTHQLDGCTPKSTHLCPLAWGNEKHGPVGVHVASPH